MKFRENSHLWRAWWWAARITEIGWAARFTRWRAAWFNGRTARITGRWAIRRASRWAAWIAHFLELKKDFNQITSHFPLPSSLTHFKNFFFYWIFTKNLGDFFFGFVASTSEIKLRKFRDFQMSKVTETFFFALFIRFVWRAFER